MHARSKSAVVGHEWKKRSLRATGPQQQSPNFSTEWSTRTLTMSDEGCALQIGNCSLNYNVHDRPSDQTLLASFNVYCDIHDHLNTTLQCPYLSVMSNGDKRYTSNCSPLSRFGDPWPTIFLISPDVVLTCLVLVLSAGALVYPTGSLNCLVSVLVWLVVLVVVRRSQTPL